MVTVKVSPLFYALALTTLLMGCGSKVMEAITEMSLSKFSILYSMDIAANSTLGAQSLCIATNQVKLTVNKPQGAFNCKVTPQLLSGYKIGPTCPGGVTVTDPAISAFEGDCEQMSICGAKRSKVELQTDGSEIWVYDSLSWGCDAKIQFSDSTNFPEGNVLNVNTIPPKCKFCTSINALTCQACEDLTADQRIVGGVVIPKTCSGAACASCTLDGVTIPHGESRNYYSQTTAQCGTTCASKSALRVCNNGAMEGPAQNLYSQCMETACPCKHPVNGIQLISGQNKTFYKTKSVTCGTSCEALAMFCRDGKFYDSTNAIIEDAKVSQYAELSCSTPMCDCPRAGRQTVFNNVPKKVWKVNKVACGESCDAQAGTVTCTNAVLTGDVSYPSDSCQISSCGCTTPWGAFIPDGQPASAYKTNLAVCGGVMCTEAANMVTVTCKGNTLTGGDLTIFKYGNCNTPQCTCNYLGKLIPANSQLDVWRVDKVLAGESCDAVKGVVRCDANFKLSGDTTFPYTECKADAAAGAGGGAGGGTGNDEGDGYGFKKPTDGGGSGCVGLGCYTNFIGAGNDYGTVHSCKLPWGGFATAGAKLVGFSRNCAVKGSDYCANYKGALACVMGRLQGNPSVYKFDSCTEQASCP